MSARKRRHSNEMPSWRHSNGMSSIITHNFGTFFMPQKIQILATNEMQKELSKSMTKAFLKLQIKVRKIYKIRSNMRHILYSK